MQPVKFQNRTEAGEKLAERLLLLKQTQLRERDSQKIIIVGIPRGGVIIADIIASKLGAKLDIVVSRKISAPDNSELAIGAVMPNGSYFLNQEIVDTRNISLDYTQAQASAQAKEIERRLTSYRGTKEYDNEFDGKTVVLVDDGIATGATMLASARWIKNEEHCEQLVIAVPVAPGEILSRLKQVADEVIVLYTPEPFIAVGRFYEDFNQVSDNEVKVIMKKYGHKV